MRWNGWRGHMRLQESANSFLRSYFGTTSQIAIRTLDASQLRSNRKNSLSR